MRQSYYNVLVPVDDGCIVYNVLHRSIAKLSSDEYAQLLDLDRVDDEVLLEELSSEGFVLEDPGDEAEQIRYRQNRYRTNKSVFELTISPTRECNYRCGYCYVLKRPGRMSADTQDRILDFVAHNYTEAPFRELKVNWYGGEPLVALDVIERLSAQLLDFCHARGIDYKGHIITNASLVDESICKRLAETCGITSIMPTLGGMGDVHDIQRCSLDGKKYFPAVMENIDHMLENGIQVRANYVVNRNNYESCKKLGVHLARKDGITTRLTRTFAYGNENMHLNDEARTPLRLFEESEFGPYYAEFFRAQKPSVEAYEYLLAPTCLYCAAWVHRSFFIDEVGDVFCCMIDMDYAVCSLFNLNDGEGDRAISWSRFLQFADLDPVNDARCRTCAVLPICQGGCAYGWLDGERACHDIKYCIEDIVADYYQTLVEEAENAGRSRDEERTRER